MRAIGEEHVCDEGVNGHGQREKGIELEIMVREPRTVNGHRAFRG